MSQRPLVSSLRTFTRLVRLQNLRRNYLQLSNLTTNQNSTRCPVRQRYFSTDTRPLQEISFEEIKKLSDKNTVIIDVREPYELVENGKIPGSINIPLGEIEQALRNLSDDQFLKKYGRKKPHESHTLIFSCKTGNRSRKAQILAVKIGYKNVMNYSGGWTDWVKKSKSQ